MREIEFRGKRVEEPIKIKHYAPDGWVYGDLITCDDGNFILSHDISGEMYIDSPYKFRANDVEARVMLAKVGENTLGQYTGLKDKNGTKIFDGDILIFCKGATHSIKVYWDCLGWKFLRNGKRIEGAFECDIASHIRQCEVIGNIYDNPELVEVDNVKD